jgi:hypothetical protein
VSCESPVDGVFDDHIRHRLARRQNRVDVFNAAGQDRDLADSFPVLDSAQFDRVKQAAGIGDRACKLRKRSWSISEPHPHANAESGGEVHHAEDGSCRGVRASAWRWDGDAQLTLLR